MGPGGSYSQGGALTVAFYYKVLHEAAHEKVPYAFDPWAPQGSLVCTAGA